MAVTNLLDRLAEDYEGLSPVEYRAALAKTGRKIGKNGLEYFVGGGSKGASARDIIRDDMLTNGKTVYPFDVLEGQKTKKRIDESKDWDYAAVDKNTGEILKTFSAENKTDAKKKLKVFQANQDLLDNGYDPHVSKELELVDNVKSNKKSAKQKRDLDEFEKSFKNVREQRDEFNQRKYKGDVLEFPLSKTRWQRVFHDQDNKGAKGARMTYGVDSWQGWLDAKRASKDAGQKLGKLFAEQNQREKNAYGNIAAGIGLSQNPVPKGTRPKYALGNQNHVYSESPDEPQNDWMNISDLQRSGHPIHYRDDGTAIVDAYTWTQKPNIENIKKTGYLAIEGSDTETFHPGTKGAWTSNVDNYPMNKNYDNGVEIFGRGRNGETFNEDLLHHRMPLGWYQKAPVIHQGRRGWGTLVDVIQAKPGAHEVMIGQGHNRRLEKVAIPPQFINRITEDKVRPGWAPLWNKEMLPGSHPNKKDLFPGNDTQTSEFIYGMTGKDFKSIQNMPEKERKRLAIQLANNDELALQYALKNVPRFNKTGLQRDADEAFLEDYIIRGNDESGRGYKRLPYDLVYTTNNPPKQKMGLVDRGNDDLSYQWADIEHPKTDKFTYRKFLDSKKLSEFIPEDAYERGLNNFYLNKYKTKDVPDNSMLKLQNVIPSEERARDLYKGYLDKIGAGYLRILRRQRESFPNRAFPESPITSNTESGMKRRSFYKEELDDMKGNRSSRAMHMMTEKGGKYDDSNFVYKNVVQNEKFRPLSSFKFDDWFESYMRKDPFYKDYYYDPVTGGDLLKNPGVQQAIAEEKERVRPFVEAYLDNLKELPSDKELAKKAYERTKRKFDSPLTREEELEFLKRRQPYRQQADSLDKVIGHMIGRRIGKDRANRGKKIF